MPLLYIFAYFLLETLAFWAVAELIGVGWALLALFVTMLCGMSIAMFEIRRLMSQKVISDGRGGLVVKQEGVGKLAGNVGLTLGGGLLLSAPGFVTSLVGLFMILPPTRALMRKVISFKVVRGVERAGVRFYEAANMSKPADSYGSFSTGHSGSSSSREHGAAEPEVIDEEELRKWSESIDPDDFTGRK
ncbi:hypothetical protein CPHO_06145 [Corynebacterium phocae]|uniref:Exlusion protein FxsA n=1 Tax=Corynebacterium phocae TaxID=161895 RepID=A0A1L7D340_9CORY|nr:FxsA family protein [Corynebacterium phocae]APT92538.1 hypothetical protein CPHO_06145 [Corynebacterium phocae]KAA8725141.1 FxsA family protein [Corynebacterium phocae]